MQTMICAAAAALSMSGWAGMSVAFAAPARPGPRPPEPRPPDELALTTERVVVFKDGHALFVKTGRATADGEGRVWTAKVPDAAVLGSFWAVSEGRTLRSMRAEHVEDTARTTEETTAITTLDLLRANPGKTVTLTLTLPDGERQESVTGRLVEVLDRPADDDARRPIPTRAYREEPGEDADVTVRELAPVGGQLVLLEVRDRGRVALPIAAVRGVAGEELATRLPRTRERITRGKRLTLDYGPEAAGKEVTVRLMYFTPGVRWIPTYRVSGDFREKATLSLQGEILNEEEDLEGVPVDLVVGVPNFRFKGTVSPLSLERVLRNALAEAAPQLMGQGNALSNAIFTQRSGEWRGESGDGSAPAIAPELADEGPAHGDLHVYPVASLTVKKGGRATVPLFDAEVPVRHVYTLDVDVVRNADGGSPSYASMGKLYGRSSKPSPLALLENRVWHQLELSNPANSPWTTGPAFLISGMLPLGQDLLTYTPGGGKARLPVTVAADLRGDFVEEEIDRKANALTWNDMSFALVKKRGKVVLKNFRKERVTMQVDVGVGGKAEAPTAGGRVALSDFRASDWNGGAWAALNPHSDVTWEVTLEPGESKTLEYVSSHYTR